MGCEMLFFLNEHIDFLVWMCSDFRARDSFYMNLNLNFQYCSSFFIYKIFLQVTTKFKDEIHEIKKS